MTTLRNNTGTATRNDKVATTALCNVCGAARPTTIGSKAHLIGRVGEPSAEGWTQRQKYLISSHSAVLDESAIGDFERMTAQMKCTPCGIKTRHSLLLPESYPGRDAAEQCNSTTKSPAAESLPVEVRELSGRGWDTAATWAEEFVNVRIHFGTFDSDAAFANSLDPIVAFREASDDVAAGWILIWEDIYGERWTVELAEEINHVGTAVWDAQSVIDKYADEVAVGPVRD